jgi:hypothetical protein
MKKLLILIIFSLDLLSCKTNTPIVQYVKSYENKDTLLILNDKIRSEILITNLKYKLNKDSINNIVSPLKEHYSSIIIKSKIIDNNIKWKKSDFNQFKCVILIESNNSFQEINDLIKKKQRIFYSFSKPYYSKDNDIVSFYVSKSNGWSNIFFGLITMRKNKNEWEIIETIESTELN